MPPWNDKKILKPSEVKLQDLFCSHRKHQLHQLISTTNIQKDKKKVKILSDTGFFETYGFASVLSAKQNVSFFKPIRNNCQEVVFQQ